MQLKYFLVLALIFTVAFFVFSCNDDDDDDNDNDDDDSATDDDGISGDDPCPSHQPELLSIEAIVNGEQVEMPVTIQSTDTLSIAFEYADQDCDLEGGKATFAPESSDPRYTDLLDAVGTLHFPLEGIGCSSEEAGELYSIEMNPADLVLPEGVERTRPWKFSISDKCGKLSDPTYLELDITVEEANS